MSSWEELKEMVKTCRKCELSETRTNAVFGEGDPKADILFVGEGPGRDEDLSGRPFVGAAGKLLTKMLEEVVGISRKDVFIANIIKCRPPNNRDPRQEEIDACQEYLYAQIAQIQPGVICTLGRHSMHKLIRPDLSISKQHGKPMRWKNALYLPMYHPAAALYRRPLMEMLREDFEKLRELKEKGF